MKSGRKRRTKREELSRLNQRFGQPDLTLPKDYKLRRFLQKSVDLHPKYVPRNSLERERYLYKISKKEPNENREELPFQSSPCHANPIENYLESIDLRSILKDFKQKKEKDYKIQTINNIVINSGRIE